MAWHTIHHAVSPHYRSTVCHAMACTIAFHGLLLCTQQSTILHLIKSKKLRFHTAPRLQAFCLAALFSKVCESLSASSPFQVRGAGVNILRSAIVFQAVYLFFSVLAFLALHWAFLNDYNRKNLSGTIFS